MLLLWVSSSSTDLPELAPHRRHVPGRLPRFQRAGPSTSLDKSIDSILLNCWGKIAQLELPCQDLKRQERAFDDDPYSLCLSFISMSHD